MDPSILRRAEQAAALVLGVDAAEVEVRLRKAGKGRGRPRVHSDDAIRAAHDAAPSFRAGARVLRMSASAFRAACKRLNLARKYASEKELSGVRGK